MTRFFKYLFQDTHNNKGNSKGILVLFLFRLAQLIELNRFTRIIFFLYLAFYRIFVEWFLCIELPWRITAGKGLTIHHGVALVVNFRVVIGENCLLRHCTTIGSKQLANGEHGNCPKIGNNVDIGSNVCILGDITIGDNVKIGAGSVIVKDIPPNSIVVGNPARIIKTIV
jgi:putative colanic acid biosynthesis acetyltransferase WcaB